MKYIWTLPKKCSFPFKSYILKARPLVSVALSSIVLMDTIDIRNPMFLFLLLPCQVTTRKSRRPPHLSVPIHAVFLHAQFKICRVLMCRHFRKQLLEGIQDLLNKWLNFSTGVPCSGGHLWVFPLTTFPEVFTGGILQWCSKDSPKDWFTLLKVASSEMLETL